MTAGLVTSHVMDIPFRDHRVGVYKASEYARGPTCSIGSTIRRTSLTSPGFASAILVCCAFCTWRPQRKWRKGELLIWSDRCTAGIANIPDGSRYLGKLLQKQNDLKTIPIFKQSKIRIEWKRFVFSFYNGYNTYYTFWLSFYSKLEFTSLSRSQ